MATRRDSTSGTEGEDLMMPVLTMREATRLLNVHSNTLRRWSDRGIVKAYRLGPRGERRFRREDIDALFTEQSGQPQANLSRAR
ncbi:MAG: helix-turn-helix domain-containing protein [Dehalococcoidia bacterium]